MQLNEFRRTQHLRAYRLRNPGAAQQLAHPWGAPPGEFPDPAQHLLAPKTEETDHENPETLPLVIGDEGPAQRRESKHGGVDLRPRLECSSRYGEQPFRAGNRLYP